VEFLALVVREREGDAVDLVGAVVHRDVDDFPGGVRVVEGDLEGVDAAVGTRLDPVTGVAALLPDVVVCGADVLAVEAELVEGGPHRLGAGGDFLTDHCGVVPGRRDSDPDDGLVGRRLYLAVRGHRDRLLALVWLAGGG